MELYPSEQKKINQICNEELVRYRDTRRTSLTALSDFAKRVMDRLEAAGFIAVVSTDIQDPKNYELIGEEDIVFVPTIDILHRVGGDAPVDFDRMQFEVKKAAGYEIAPDGTKKQFDTKLHG